MTNNPQLDPMPAGASLLDPVKTALINTMIKTATDKAGVAVGEFVAASAPTIVAMGLNELAALSDALANNNTAAAMEQIASHSSLSQLADQKKTLADMTTRMAQSNVDARNFWSNFVYRGLTLALSALVLL